MTSALPANLVVPLLAATHPTLPDVGVFAVAAAIILAGAIGVVVARNPVHSALMLVMTLFGVAVMFVLQQASFLAAVQVIVYAGAIVVLFLFVIMFLGVDQVEDVAAEPLRGQRPLAIALMLLGTTGLLLLGEVSKWTTGQPSASGSDTGAPNVNLIGRSLYTTYLFPFEVTSALLIIAVVGAVVLARRPPSTTPAVDGTAGTDGTDSTASTDGAAGTDSTDSAAGTDGITADANPAGDSDATDLVPPGAEPARAGADERAPVADAGVDA